MIGALFAFFGAGRGRVLGLGKSRPSIQLELFTKRGGEEVCSLLGIYPVRKMGSGPGVGKRGTSGKRKEFGFSP